MGEEVNIFHGERALKNTSARCRSRESEFGFYMKNGAR